MILICQDKTRVSIRGSIEDIDIFQLERNFILDERNENPRSQN